MSRRGRRARPARALAGLLAIVLLVGLPAAVAAAGPTRPATAVRAARPTSASPGARLAAAGETEPAYKASCTLHPAYRRLAGGTALRGRCVRYKAQVFQYNRTTGRQRMLVDVTNTGHGIWDTVVEVELPAAVGGRAIYQDDVVEFWGTVAGTAKAKTQFGGAMTVPVVQARYLTLISSAATTPTTLLTT